MSAPTVGASPGENGMQTMLPVPDHEGERWPTAPPLNAAGTAQALRPQAQQSLWESH